MKLAYVSTYDANDIRQWSGTPYYMTRAFQQSGVSFDFLGPLLHELPPFFRVKQLWKRLAFSQRQSSRFNPYSLQAYARQLEGKLTGLKVEALLTSQVNPVAYLNGKKPLVLWTDALYAGLLGFYPPSENLSRQSVAEGNAMTQEALKRCQLLIFSSDWAARSAMELYGASRDKIRVVPYGANLDCQHQQSDIQGFLKKRSSKKLKLLFIGKQWDIKGGDVVFKVAKALAAAGEAVELNFVGCYPPAEVEIPSYIKCHGFISKQQPEGVAKLTQLLQESHVMFMPSQAEAYGIVFCEANAYALPCLTTQIGGISSVVKDNINGMTFAHEASVEDYCAYLTSLMQDYNRYETLALSAFHEYETRLNWRVATQQVKDMIAEML